MLIVVEGAIDPHALKEKCASAIHNGDELAVCRVLAGRDTGTEDALRAQREVTVALRRVLGADAEAVAVLVASDRDGDRVDDCAQAWGATVVKP